MVDGLFPEMHDYVMIDIYNININDDNKYSRNWDTRHMPANCLDDASSDVSGGQMSVSSW